MLRLKQPTKYCRYVHAKKTPLGMDNYVWIDLEMTGLDVNIHTILEAACIVTNTDLKPLHRGFQINIHHPEEVLQNMNEWSRVQHAKSGLTFECRNSKISIQEADKMLADYIKTQANTGGERYIAGNSVYMDKIFIQKHMPITNSLLHYRIIDVSTLKTLCAHWYPTEYPKLLAKKFTHRALDDILESIGELKDLRKIMFKGEF